ncbi:MAG: hypothetical protein ACREQA_01445 [Candidatus Binatia bacterium]
MIVLKRLQPLKPSQIAERVPAKEPPLEDIAAEVHRMRRETILTDLGKNRMTSLAGERDTSLDNHFSLHHFRFHLEPKAPLQVPAYNKGNVIRGGFGSTFRRIVCHRKMFWREPETCELRFGIGQTGQGMKRQVG